MTHSLLRLRPRGLLLSIPLGVALYAGGCSSSGGAGGLPAAGKAGTAGQAGSGAGGGGSTGDGGDCELVIVCDGNSVAEFDPCTSSRTVIESCSGGTPACYQGGCVACAPNAGKVCVGKELVEVDSCGQSGASESCSNRCLAGACVGAQCQSGAKTDCHEDSLVSFDSCGNIDNVILKCAAGCSGGACTGCTPDYYISCFDGDVYSLDSCGVLGTKKEDCGTGSCVASPGSITCQAGVTCTKDNKYTCLNGNLHFVDTCGATLPEIYQDCPNGCDNTGCLPCVPVEVGKSCVGSAVHKLMGGCGGTPTVGAKVEDCANGCQNGACLPPGCIPNAGRKCVGSAVYATDSCGATGALIENCPAGCENGACKSGGAGGSGGFGGSSGSGGTGATGGGGTGGGGGIECSCTASGSFVQCWAYGGVDETFECTGCFGYDGACPPDPKQCDACLAEFKCDSNLDVWLGVPGSGQKIGECKTLETVPYELCYRICSP
jgi:hypothetical protein